MILDDWSKTFIKFSAELRKLTPELQKYTMDDAETLLKAVQDRDSDLEKQEKKLRAAALAAYEAGMTGTKLADFLKDKDFADAKKLLDTSCKLLASELKLLDTHCDKCRASANKAYELAQAMAKAIAADKTKDKNLEREKVKKMREGLMAQFEELTNAYKLRYKVPPHLNVYEEQYDKFITHLIAKAMKKGKDPEKQLQVPVPLTDKKLGMMVKEADHLAAQVLANMTKNFALKDSKPTAAAPFLKKAEADVAKIRKISDEASALERKFKNEIAELKERLEILKQFKSIHETLEKSEKILEEGPPNAKAKAKDDKVG
ncbi:hypothetical protein GC209_14845 [bacterium]|nr:hypothetical protein [bacterium]